MRVAGVIRDSLVNGEGLRDVVFMQGCPHHCFNCQNPQTWDYYGGKELTAYELAEMFKDSPNNITISGGEPFLQWRELLYFMHHVKIDNPNKQFWIYTGFQYEDVRWIVENYLMYYVKVVVDGEYIEDLKSQDCLYRGSTNQRLIDVRQTNKYGHVVLWEGKNEA